MSRYLLLLLLNTPFILAGILSAFTAYGMKRSSRRRLVVQVIMWIIVFTGLALAQPLYNWLFSHNLTQTEALSLFDVVQITAIVIVFYIANRTRAKLDVVERRLQDLHRELSITLSDINNTQR